MLDLVGQRGTDVLPDFLEQWFTTVRIDLQDIIFSYPLRYSNCVVSKKYT
jgi:hypothetical protein